MTDAADTSEMIDDGEVEEVAESSVQEVEELKRQVAELSTKLKDEQKRSSRLRAQLALTTAELATEKEKSKQLDKQLTADKNHGRERLLDNWLLDPAVARALESIYAAQKNPQDATKAARDDEREREERARLSERADQSDTWRTLARSLHTQWSRRVRTLERQVRQLSESKIVADDRELPIKKCRKNGGTAKENDDTTTAAAATNTASVGDAVSAEAPALLQQDGDDDVEDDADDDEDNNEDVELVATDE